MGAWVITGPAGFGSFAGMLGIWMYALAAGIPFIMIAYAGEKIQSKVPHVLSLTSYMGWRFGELSRLYVFIVTLFNMSIALLAEYYTISLIFKYFVGSAPYPMVIVVGLLTLAYTAYGGLMVSVFTDSIQGVASVGFFVILGIYMAATFRPGELETPMPCDPTSSCVSGTPNCAAWDGLEAECPISGYSSILTLPAGLFAATVFSEAMWQRAWCSQGSKNLKKGAWFGFGMVFIMVLFAGLTGVFAIWAQKPNLMYLEESELINGSTVYTGIPVVGDLGGGNTTTFEASYDLLLFQVLYGGKFPNISNLEFAKTVGGFSFYDFTTNYISYPTVQNWIGVVTVVLAILMNEGAVDSIQNGIAGATTGYIVPLIPKWNLLWTRAIVVIINGALIGVGTWLAIDNVSVTVIQLFLITNLLSCCSAIPVLLGLSTRLHNYVGGGSFLFSCLFSIFCLCVYGVNFFYDTYSEAKYPKGFYVDFYGHNYTVGSFSSAMYYTWIGNDYKWQFFLLPLGVSTGSMLLCCTIFYVLKEVKPVRKFLERIDVYKWIDHPLPLITAVATHDHMYANDDYRRFGSKAKLAGSSEDEAEASSTEEAEKPTPESDPVKAV